MKVDDKTRECRVWECDHMRLVVNDGDRWRHLTITGSLGGDCAAGVYAVEARVTGSHSIAVHHTGAYR